jgi:c-di-GMP-binding flagellar brake protein YcgR
MTDMKTDDQEQQPPLDGPSVPGVGRLVRLEIRSRTETVPSRIEDDRNGVLVLSIPQRDGDSPIVRDGETIIVTWETRKGQARMAAAVVSSDEGHPPTCTVRQASEVQLVQRRRFVRTQSPRPIELLLAPERSVPAMMVELSEGGMSCEVFAAVKLLEDAVVGVELKMDDDTIVPLRARVVRAEPVGQGRCRVGFAFVDVDERRAAVLRRHVFAEQLRHRQEDR